jgi:hypothetical protein
VVAQPTWDIVTINPAGAICAGEQVELTATVQGGVKDASGNTNGIIQWKTVDGTDTLDVAAGIGGHVFDTPSKNIAYRPTYSNPLGNGCKLADGKELSITVNSRPSIVSMKLDGTKEDTVLCGNDIQSIINLDIEFKGKSPFRFELTESTQKGVKTQILTTMDSIYTIQLRPTETARYTISMLEDSTNCPAFTNTLTKTVTVNVTHVENLTMATTCGELIAGNKPLARVYFDIVSVPLTGNPTTADIHFVDSTCNGVNTTNQIISVSGNLNYIEFETPTDPGDYEMLLIINGCEYPFILKVLRSNSSEGGNTPLVVQRWDDVVVVNNNPDNNGGYKFTSYQWYKNGELIPGATNQYYQEIGGINGYYSVKLIGTDANNNPVQMMTCETYFAGKGATNVYPVPARTYQGITIEMSLSQEELDGAVLDIYTIAGQHLRQVKVTSNVMKIDGFAAPAAYIGKITTGTKEMKVVKMVVIE